MMKLKFYHRCSSDLSPLQQDSSPTESPKRK
ncbi:MAG: hypothetical protein K1000chlam2_00812, partial [Chlamydiae bacterium]|nr:hypothetical protein [Chlamydiota bacterium]